MNQVLIAAPISEKFTQFLLEKNYELIYFDNNISTLNKKFATGIITSNKLVLSQSEIEKYPKLKWIGRIGSGMEIIDIDFCKHKNIQCVSSPNGIANSVAEHTIGLLLGLQHKIFSSFEQIKNKQWIRESNRGIELENLTIGIIGYGHTGSALAKKLSVFTKNILVHDKYKTNFSNEYVQEVSLDELQKQADVISFHLPLNNETTYFYNEAFMMTSKPKHILVNTSRGAIVDTNVLLNGLKRGFVLGACLDVVEEEKNIKFELESKENNIQKLLEYNVIITPHIAGYSQNAIEKMSQELMNKIHF